MAKFKNSRPSGRSAPVPITQPAFQIIETRCKVCTHPQRREVDMMLALGWSQAEVIRHWNYVMELQGLPDDELFTRSGMSNHAMKHLSIKDKGVRRVLEQRARTEGIDVDMVEGFILTKQGVAESLIASGLESLHRGHTTVEPKDVLTALKTLDELEKDRASQLEETMLRELRAFTEAVKSVVPEDQWDLIYERFEQIVGNFNPAILPAPDVVSYEEVIEEAEFDDNQLQLFEMEEHEDGLS